MLKKARERDVDIVSDKAKLSCLLYVFVHGFYTTIKVLDVCKIFVHGFPLAINSYIRLVPTQN